MPQATPEPPSQAGWSSQSTVGTFPWRASTCAGNWAAPLHCYVFFGTQGCCYLLLKNKYSFPDRTGETRPCQGRNRI